MDGVLNVYKEKGYTSHDVVAKLRGILKQKKIGHTGTLDPDAEGVLPVCLGNATKLCDMLTDKSKEYEAVMLLGRVTDTQDISGRILSETDAWNELSEEKITDVIASFTGSYDQIPPMYSALKVNGRKLYELAREGMEVERKPRTVAIENIDVLEMSLPRVRIRVACSKGTYIRTLCNDIGEKLSCGACMEELVRTMAAGFEIKDSLKLAEIETLAKNGEIFKRVIPVWDMFPSYESIRTKAASDKLLKNGNKLPADSTDKNPGRDCLVKMYSSSGIFMGIYRYEKKTGIFKPEKMFL